MAETATTASTVSVTHVDPMPKASVRAATGTPAASALGLTFGSAEQRGDALVARVRPDEWYLLGDSAHAMVDGLDLTGFASTVDLSHARHAVRVTGERAADTLAKLCSADLTDSMTPNGAVWGNSVAGVTCDIVRDDQAGQRSYLLLFDGSFLAYLLGALQDAAAEF